MSSSTVWAINNFSQKRKQLCHFWDLVGRALRCLSTKIRRICQICIIRAGGNVSEIKLFFRKYKNVFILSDCQRKLLWTWNYFFQQAFKVVFIESRGSISWETFSFEKKRKFSSCSEVERITSGLLATTLGTVVNAWFYVSKGIFSGHFFGKKWFPNYSRTLTRVSRTFGVNLSHVFQTSILRVHRQNWRKAL